VHLWVLGLQEDLLFVLPLDMQPRACVLVLLYGKMNKAEYLTGLRVGLSVGRS
jgi:hypothetical protein